MNPFEQEMQERGRRYFRKRQVWEVVEGLVITLLFIGMVWWVVLVTVIIGIDIINWFLNLI